MKYNIKDEVLTGVIKTALQEYMDEAEKTFPPEKELEKLYPVSKKFKRRYERIAKAKEYRQPLCAVYLKRIAVVFLIVIALSFAMLLTSAQVRAAVSDTVVEWYDKYMKISFSKDTSIADKDVSSPYDLAINYVPDRFELSSASEFENTREYFYTSDNDDYLIIGIYSSEYTDIAVDIEQMEYETTEINGNTAYISYNKEERSGVVVAGNKIYTIWISGIVEKNEMLKIAENISK